MLLSGCVETHEKMKLLYWMSSLDLKSQELEDIPLEYLCYVIILLHIIKVQIL